MRRSAGFTAIAVGSLAVGIGAATATFAVTEAVMLRPLPVRSPDAWSRSPLRLMAAGRTWSYAAFARWQRLPAQEVSTRWRPASDVRPFRSARGSGEPPEEVRVSLVSTTTSMRSALASCWAGRSPEEMPPHPARGRRDHQRRLLAPAVRRRARRAGEDHRTGRGSVRCRRRRRIRIHRALRRPSRRHVGPADDAAGAAAGNAGPVGRERGSGSAMAQGRRPARRRCQRRARRGCGASGAPGVPHRKSGAAGCRQARGRARSHRVVPSRCRRDRRRCRARTIRAGR